MYKFKATLVMFVWLVCFSLFGQNGGIIQIVRTNDQIGFLLEGPNSNGFFTDAFILEFKGKSEKSEEFPILTNDPDRIAVAPTLVHSSVNFLIKNDENTVYYVEFFDLRGNKTRPLQNNTLRTNKKPSISILKY